MRELTLVRHAHAERQSHDGEDFERALDKRGRRDARRMGLQLAHLHYRADHLITSPAVRAVETAKALAHALDFPLQRIRHDDRVYLAEPEALLEILRHAPSGAGCVLLVGHNPGLSTLAGRLDAADDVGELPTAAILTLRFAIADWSTLVWRSGERVRLLSPDDVGDES